VRIGPQLILPPAYGFAQRKYALPYFTSGLFNYFQVAYAELGLQPMNANIWAGKSAFDRCKLYYYEREYLAAGGAAVTKKNVYQ